MGASLKDDLKDTVLCQAYVKILRTVYFASEAGVFWSFHTALSVAEKRDLAQLFGVDTLDEDILSGNKRSRAPSSTKLPKNSPLRDKRFSVVFDVREIKEETDLVIEALEVESLPSEIPFQDEEDDVLDQQEEEMTEMHIRDQVKELLSDAFISVEQSFEIEKETVEEVVETNTDTDMLVHPPSVVADSVVDKVEVVEEKPVQPAEPATPTPVLRTCDSVETLYEEKQKMLAPIPVEPLAPEQLKDILYAEPNADEIVYYATRLDLVTQSMKQESTWIHRAEEVLQVILDCLSSTEKVCFFFIR